MITYKSIGWAFPTSINAKELGFYHSGCWHVSQTYINIEGSGQCNTFLPHDAEGFNEPDHPDLIALFNEYDGEIEPCFIAYGNQRALAAINA